ncbi:MAG: HAD-IIIA family hydrolase [Candidatus Dormibacteria bacterium]
MTAPRYDVVIPTVGRPSLNTLLTGLRGMGGPRPERIIVVDDRRGARRPLPLGDTAGEGLVVVACGGRGPAAARNAGRRRGSAPWVTFLDDDVELLPGWAEALEQDLASAPAGVAGVQGRVVVPLPTGRRPTDWERNVAGLAHAHWATADMAFRRPALASVGGFDERFRRAYREDSDLALRLMSAGWNMARGTRAVLHPVRAASRWVSLTTQTGNGDDAVMRALHGAGWRKACGAHEGRRSRHLLVTAGAVTALTAAPVHRGLSRAGLTLWASLTAAFARERISPGPRDAAEVATMIATSMVIPPLACLQWLRGFIRARRRAGSGPWTAADAGIDRDALPDAVLFDRDGTLVIDVAYNGDPGRVRLMPRAREALGRLHALGIPVGVISNQSAVGLGLITTDQMEAVNRRLGELVGPVATWQMCPHTPEAGCVCRKPAPELVERAARQLGVDPARCAVVGDIAADMDAARAAGARAVLVPTAATEAADVMGAPATAPDLSAAVDLIVSGAL